MARPTPLNLDNIQRTSFSGFTKGVQSNLFLKFTGDKAGRAWIAEVAAEVFGSGVMIQFNNEFLALKKMGAKKPEAVISAERVNLAFSFAGLQALSVNAADLAMFPDTFRNGMAKAAIGDVETSDPSSWMPPFTTPAQVHAVLIVAADHDHELARKVADITGTAAFNAGVQLLLNQQGRTRSDALGHEYFGFKEEVSEPGVCGAHSGEFVIGYETQIPTAKPCQRAANPDPGPIREFGSEWTKDGAYFVFRRLRQDAPALEKSIESLAKLLGWSEEMTGAKLVGRYKSGCQITQRKFQTGAYAPPSIDTTEPTRIDPGKAPLAVQHSVTRTRGEYFFSPSLDTLQALGTGTI